MGEGVCSPYYRSTKCVCMCVYVCVSIKLCTIFVVHLSLYLQALENTTVLQEQHEFHLSENTHTHKLKSFISLAACILNHLKSGGHSGFLLKKLGFKRDKNTRTHTHTHIARIHKHAVQKGGRRVHIIRKSSN